MPHLRVNDPAEDVVGREAQLSQRNRATRCQWKLRQLLYSCAKQNSIKNCSQDANNFKGMAV